MILKAIMIILSAIVGLLCLAIIWLLGYSILWMIRERMDVIEEQNNEHNLHFGDDVK